MAVSPHSECKFFPSIIPCDVNPHQPDLICQHLEVLDSFAWENINALYKFHFSERWDTPFAEVPSHKLHFRLDHGIHLQHLSRLDSQYEVGFRLMSSGPQGGGNCFYCAYSSGMPPAQELYCFCYMDILASLP
ncbi:mCG132192, partial [Mus musculus]